MKLIPLKIEYNNIDADYMFDLELKDQISIFYHDNLAKKILWDILDKEPLNSMKYDILVSADHSITYGLKIDKVEKIYNNSFRLRTTHSMLDIYIIDTEQDL